MVMATTQYAISSKIHIKDVIVEDSSEVLFLVRGPTTLNSPMKENLLCQFSDLIQFAFIMSLELYTFNENRVAMCFTIDGSHMGHNHTPPHQIGPSSKIRMVKIYECKVILWNSTNLVEYKSFATKPNLKIILWSV